MQLVTPIFTQQITPKETAFYRVLPGNPRDLKLSQALIAVVRFNSKMDGVKIHSKGNWFLKPEELNFINRYVKFHSKKP